MIASLKVRVKDPEGQNVGLQDRAVAAEKREEEAKKREDILSNVINEALGQLFKGFNSWAGRLVGCP